MESCWNALKQALFPCLASEKCFLCYLKKKGLTKELEAGRPPLHRLKGAF